MKSNILKLFIGEILYKLNYTLKMSDTLYHTILSKLYTDGIYIYNSAINKEVCKSKVEYTKNFLEQNNKIVHMESNDSDKRIYGVERFTNEYNINNMDQMADTLFSHFSFNLIQEKFKLLGNINYNKTNIGSGNGWHRDAPYMHQFKAILYLNDVTKDNGPFMYIKKSHRLKNYLKVHKYLNSNYTKRRFSDDEIEKLVQEKILPNPTSCIAKSGSIIFVNTRGLHRGKKLLNGTRFTLTNYYFNRKLKKGQFYL